MVKIPSIRDVGSMPGQRTNILHAMRNGQKIRNPPKPKNQYIYIYISCPSAFFFGDTQS